MRRLILAAALPALAATSATAAERRWPVATVERLRVETPATVRVVVAAPEGAGTGVAASAVDPAALDALKVEANGGSLVLRGGAASAGAVVTVVAPRLAGVAVYTAARVAVAAMRGERVELSAAAGSIDVAAIEAAALSATLAGDATITLAGRAPDAMLVANGTGTIDARALATQRLTVRGAGDSIVRAAASQRATVVAIQNAQVSVAGRPRCDQRAVAPATVTCGR
ncbi:GIN domain-containing protein [Sphingomonas citri]